MSQKFFVEDRTVFFRWGSNPIKIRDFSNPNQARRAKQYLLISWSKMKKKKQLADLLEAFEAEMDLRFNDGQIGLQF